jgi:hypothetical protein
MADGEFQPLKQNSVRNAVGGTVFSNADQRIAHALEYIAAQLGQINRKLDRLIFTERSGEHDARSPDQS